MVSRSTSIPRDFALTDIASAENKIIELLHAHGGKAKDADLIRHAGYMFPASVVSAAYWSLVREGKAERRSGHLELACV